MPALIVGRILGGLSTSLLFSTFESWMVSEHRKRGFSEDLLVHTFSIMSWGNGLMAILAGIIAQLTSGRWPDSIGTPSLTQSMSIRRIRRYWSISVGYFADHCCSCAYPAVARELWNARRRAKPVSTLTGECQDMSGSIR